MNTIFLISILVGFLTIVSAFIYSILKSKQHKSLCRKFHEKYSYYPNDIAVYESSGILFTFQKDIHFLLALLFPKDSFFVRNINKDLYEFIREQPESETRWIKLKFSLLLFGVFILITDYVLFTLFIKSVN